MAVLTRNQPRDFVDLYFLLREGLCEILDQLLELVRAKFDVDHIVLGTVRYLTLADSERKNTRRTGSRSLAVAGQRCLATLDVDREEQLAASTQPS